MSFLNIIAQPEVKVIRFSDSDPFNAGQGKLKSPVSFRTRDPFGGLGRYPPERSPELFGGTEPQAGKPEPGTSSRLCDLSLAATRPLRGS